MRYCSERWDSEIGVVEREITLERERERERGVTE